MVEFVKIVCIISFILGVLLFKTSGKVLREDEITARMIWNDFKPILFGVVVGIVVFLIIK